MIVGDPTSHGLCTCQRCHIERALECKRLNAVPGGHSQLLFEPPGQPGWAYACAICGKCCLHHADHRFVCTGSNETGQVGVIA